MSKRQKQTAFLKALVRRGELDERAQLQERISRAERDEQCARRALWLVCLLALFSCFGLCYSAVLIPELFQNSWHGVVKVFCGLGLTALICAVAFLGFWMWCRSVLNRVQEDCRRFVMAMLEPNGRSNFAQFFPRDQQAPKAGTLAVPHLGLRQGNSPVLPACQPYSQLFSLRRVS